MTAWIINQRCHEQAFQNDVPLDHKTGLQVHSTTDMQLLSQDRLTHRPPLSAGSRYLVYNVEINTLCVNWEKATGW